MEQALVQRAGIDYTGIHTGKIRGVNPLRAAGSGSKMIAGVRESVAAVDRFRPDVCLVTGGYVCAPVVVACRLRRVPVVIYLPDVIPGWSIKRMSRFAARVAVSLPAAAAHFGGEAPQGKAVVTGYPVRQELIDAVQDSMGARRKLAVALGEMQDQTLGAADGLPLVLIWGGSQGSRSINRATWAILEDILPAAHIVHVVGERDWPLYTAFAQETQPNSEFAGRYHPVAYLHEEMALALAAADLTVARAGASALGEFPVAALPSILIPLPMAGVNQSANALELADAGAAIVVDDGALPDGLLSALQAVLFDPARRSAMSAAARDLAQPHAARNIAELLAEVAASTSEGHGKFTV